MKNSFVYKDGLVIFKCRQEDFVNFAEGASVYVFGTFNMWLSDSPVYPITDISLQAGKWQLSLCSGDASSCDAAMLLESGTIEAGDYFLCKPYRTVDIPGNTGFGEYQFMQCVNGERVTLVPNPSTFNNILVGNHVVYNPATDTQEFQRIAQFKAEKSLADFDLNCPACRADIANVRRVPSTTCLYRGYNPFKKSKSQYNTEDTRIQLVNKFYEIYAIKSDITLNGPEAADSTLGESPSKIVDAIEQHGNRLCVDIDYAMVYYKSDTKEFDAAFCQIARFIINHPAPFYIHCRLGSDRTGVTCAVLAILCGAQWQEVAHDYERTSNMGIKEFRHRRLLAHSLSNMLGIDATKEHDLCKKMRAHFVSRGTLTQSEIDILVQKLTAPQPSPANTYFDLQERHTCSPHPAK